MLTDREESGLKFRKRDSIRSETQSSMEDGRRVGKMGKWLVTVLLVCAVFLIVSGSIALADDSAYYSDLKNIFRFAFYDSDDHCAVSGRGASTTGDIVIPSTVTVRKGDGLSLPSGVESKTYTVTEVGSFQNTTITSVVFPETLTKISDSAFLNVTTLSGDLKIPDSVTEIGGQAFRGCTGLNGTLTLGSGLTAIKSYTFYQCGFTGTLTIPGSVTYIENYAFQGCTGFTGDLTIQASVEKIYNRAFYGCTGFDGTLTLLCTNAYIQGETFENCSGFTSLVLADGTTSIKDSEFAGCSGLKGTLIIPDSVTSIGAHAFDGCSGFTGVLTIPSGITELSYCAFRGCSGFTGLVLPEGLTKIESNAFQNCTGMTGTLRLPGSIQEVWNGAFENCSFTGDLNLPEGLTTLSSCSFACPYITGTLTIPSSASGISTSQAFLGMLRVQKIVNNSTDKIRLADNFIEETDKETYFIKSGTTEHLTVYTGSQSSGKMYTTIGQGIYYRNGTDPEVFGTADFVLPSNVTAIQEEAFAGTEARVVEIPASCGSIGDYAFRDCVNLQQIRIPSTCALGKDVFDGCGDVSIFGAENSPAYTYCQTHDNCKFVKDTQ